MNDLALLLLFLLAAAFLLRIDFIYYIVYVCTGVYLLSYWFTPRVLGGLSLDRLFQDHAFWGERIRVTLRVTNNSRWPIPWVQLAESIPVDLGTGSGVRTAISLAGRQTRSFTYELSANRRGYYRIGPMLLTAGDLFGFREQSASIPAAFMTVYPRIIPLVQLGLPSRMPFGTLPSGQRLFEDPARPAGVREYEIGDSLRHINWKVSAHNEQLLVKTYQPAISLDTVILLNLNSREYSPRTRYDSIEWAIVVAASLAAHLTGQRQAVGLSTNGLDPLRERGISRGKDLSFGEDSGRLTTQTIGFDSQPWNGSQGQRMSATVPPRPGRANLMKVLECLARVEATPTQAFQTWAPRACLNLSWGVTILAISPAGDDATCQTLHELARGGFNPVLVVIEPYANFKIVRERARSLGFPAFHVATRQDLDDWRRPRTIV